MILQGNITIYIWLPTPVFLFAVKFSTIVMVPLAEELRKVGKAPVKNLYWFESRFRAGLFFHSGSRVCSLFRIQNIDRENKIIYGEKLSIYTFPHLSVHLSLFNFNRNS